MREELNMDTMMFEIDKDACSEEAQRIFLEISGINRKTGRLSTRLRQSAVRVRRAIEDKINVRVGYAFYDQVSITGRTAHIGTEQIICPAFEQIESTQIKGAYVYALTVGDFRITEEEVLDQLYADLWGSAFVDAARFQFRDVLKQSAVLSDSFGPGFYGMEVREMTTLSKLLNFDSVGIKVHEGGAIMPLKSCAGVLFSVTADYKPLCQECASCLGVRASCTLCQVHGGRM